MKVIFYLFNAIPLVMTAMAVPTETEDARISTAGGLDKVPIGHTYTSPDCSNYGAQPFFFPPARGKKIVWKEGVRSVKMIFSARYYDNPFCLGMGIHRNPHQCGAYQFGKIYCATFV